MREGRRNLFILAWQRHPGLHAVHQPTARSQRRVGAFGMHDAATCGHPVNLAWADLLADAETVAVMDLTVEQIGYCRQADMGCARTSIPSPERKSAGPM
jgi:hypothetical protein